MSFDVNDPFSILELNVRIDTETDQLYSQFSAKCQSCGWESQMVGGPRCDVGALYVSWRNHLIQSHGLEAQRPNCTYLLNLNRCRLTENHTEDHEIRIPVS